LQRISTLWKTFSVSIRRHCDQVTALKTFFASGFENTLKTGVVFLELTAAYDTIWHTGLLYKLSQVPAFLVHSDSGTVHSCCYKTTFSGSIWETMSVPGEGRQTVYPSLALTLSNKQSHVAAGLSMPMTFAVLSKQKLSSR